MNITCQYCGATGFHICKGVAAQPADQLAATLDQRGKRYGEFVDQAKIAQNIKAAMTSGRMWVVLADDQREALEMIANKIARILNGDPNYDDSWLDIAGYARLISDRLHEPFRQMVNPAVNEEAA